MPRRARRGAAGSDGSSGADRVSALLAKILAALQDHHALRCDLAGTRSRALLLDAEYHALNDEYERALAARDRLDALSRELTRQNKLVISESEARKTSEKEMRSVIVHRFNDAMLDINAKLARQSDSREERDAHLTNLQHKLADLQERYDTRGQHFEQQLHRRQLEARLAEARRREVTERHRAIKAELVALRGLVSELRASHEDLAAKMTHYEHSATRSEKVLEESQGISDSNRQKILEAHGQVKDIQAANAMLRKKSTATAIHVKSMEAERRRLDNAMAETRETELGERAKREALEKLCRQVTDERAELEREILVMQDAWSNLKLEIESLKAQVGGGNHVFDVLQDIMNRESAGRFVGW